MNCNDFADKLRESILSGDRIFDIVDKHDDGREETYTFFRVPRWKFDALGFAHNYRDDEPVNSYGTYGMIVGETFYTFAQNDFLPPIDRIYRPEQLSDENRAFFNRRIDDVYDKLVVAVEEALAAHADGLTENNIPLSVEKKAKITESIDLDGNIARNEAPVRVLPKAGRILKSPFLDAVEYIYHGSDYVMSVVDKFFADEDLRESFYHSCYRYLTAVRMYNERTASLSPVEVTVRAINKAFSDAKGAGAKTVRVIVEGKDELLNKHAVERYANGNFSIEGIEVVGKFDPDRLASVNGLPTYAFDYVSPKMKAWSNRKADYLNKIPVMSILRIEYGKKVLYSRSA